MSVLTTPARSGPTVSGLSAGQLHVLLRIGVAACFIGHGAFGIMRKEAWLPFFELFGIGSAAALTLMPIIGSADIAVGLLALLHPFRALLLYAAAWCAWTAALRPLAGLSVWELVERAGNYGVPLAMLMLVGIGGGARGWLRRIHTGVVSPGGLRRTFVVLQWATAALLTGHGALALGGKPELSSHLAAAGLGAGLLPWLGALEIGLAAAVLFRPHLLLFAGVALWKLATESLFVVAGSPFWEVVERGGSYVAPMAAGALLAAPALRRAEVRTLTKAATISAAVMLALVGAWSLAAPAPTFAAAAAPAVPGRGAPDPELVDRLRQGGLVLACRHAITDRRRGDRRVDLDDPSTQRVLSEAGERQARAIGAEIRRLRIPIGEVLASPYDRTFRSAELSFGRARKEPLLMYDGWSRQSGMELVTRPPADGTNRVLMTHQGILYRALPIQRGSVAEGECVVVEPGNSLEVLGSLDLDDWREAR